MRCPKDANRSVTIINNWCGKTNSNNIEFWVCTRPKGHKGMHHSHNTDNICNAKWD